MTKIKDTLNKASKELSSKLLFYDEFINIDDYKVKIIDHEDYEGKDVDCFNNILYIDKTMINSISLKSILKHKLLHSYLYNITDIDLKRLSIDTSYLFILYCLATDSEVGYCEKNTVYYNKALQLKDLIKSRPYLIDLLYVQFIDNEKLIIYNLNKLAESEWFRINSHEYLVDIDNEKSILNILELINKEMNLIYKSYYLDSNVFSDRLEKENA